MIEEEIEMLFRLAMPEDWRMRMPSAPTEPPINKFDDDSSSNFGATILLESLRSSTSSYPVKEETNFWTEIGLRSYAQMDFDLELSLERPIYHRSSSRISFGGRKFKSKGAFKGTPPIGGIMYHSTKTSKMKHIRAQSPPELTSASDLQSFLDSDEENADTRNEKIVPANALYLINILRLTIDCPFKDIRKQSSSILFLLKDKGITIPYTLIDGPSYFIHPLDCPSIDVNRFCVDLGLSDHFDNFCTRRHDDDDFYQIEDPTFADDEIDKDLADKLSIQKVGTKIVANSKSGFVRILVWSRYFSDNIPEDEHTRKVLLELENMDCQEWCEVVGDRNLLNYADALVWHSWPGDIRLWDLPPVRNPNQPWVWWYRETPFLTQTNLANFNNLFNWTMTYRRDSDILFMYGQIIPLSTPKSLTDLEWLANEVDISAKTKLVAAVISKCSTPSQREKLIALLKKNGLPVDMYGACGRKVTEPAHEFWQRLGKEYKFYLTFENALCEDYVTEKLFRTLKIGIVPVVYGAANYTQVAPPNSFINVGDFSSTEELVKFLKMLDSNPHEYAKYFEWRKHYRVLDYGRGFCALCEKVRDENLGRQHKSSFLSYSRSISYPAQSKVYTDLYNWWWTHSQTNQMAKQSNDPTKIPACTEPDNEPFWKELHFSVCNKYHIFP